MYAVYRTSRGSAAQHKLHISLFLQHPQPLSAGVVAACEVDPKGNSIATKLGARTYEVTSVQKVKETDTSGTVPSTENMLTLYTCVRNQRTYRWQVQAAEVV